MRHNKSNIINVNDKNSFGEITAKSEINSWKFDTAVLNIFTIPLNVPLLCPEEIKPGFKKYKGVEI